MYSVSKNGDVFTVEEVISWPNKTSRRYYSFNLVTEMRTRNTSQNSPLDLKMCPEDVKWAMENYVPKVEFAADFITTNT